MSHLQRAIDQLTTQKALASAISASLGREVSQQLISYWLQVRDGEVPAEYCRAIEDVTNGAVTRYELRPDVFGPPPSEMPRAVRSKQVVG